MASPLRAVAFVAIAWLCAVSPALAGPLLTASAATNAAADDRAEPSTQPLPPQSPRVIAQIAAVLAERAAREPEALNPHRALLASTDDAIALRGPPLIVGSEGAQRFFDRLHGFAAAPKAATKAVDEDDEAFGLLSRGLPIAEKPATDTHQAIVSHYDGKIATAALDAGDATTHDAAASTTRNWILVQATHQSAEDAEPIVQTIDLSDAQSRQMFASLSDRIIGQLMAGNRWVNFTQSMQPLTVHSLDGVPIGQMPFVVVQPTTAKPAAPVAEQKPPRRGWFSFQRPWTGNRIYGEGTESRFPPLVERVVQRIQHYFSVFRYADESRPSVGQNNATSADDGIAENSPTADDEQPTVIVVQQDELGDDFDSDDTDVVETTTAQTTSIIGRDGNVAFDGSATTGRVETDNGASTPAVQSPQSSTSVAATAAVADEMSTSQSFDDQTNFGGLQRLNEITGDPDATKHFNEQIIRLNEINTV